MGGRGPQWWSLGNTGFLTPVDNIYKLKPQCSVFGRQLVGVECPPKFLSSHLVLFSKLKTEFNCFNFLLLFLWPNWPIFAEFLPCRSHFCVVQQKVGKLEARDNGQVR